MHNTVAYDQKDRAKNDAKAIADTKEWCSPKQWDALQQAVGAIQVGSFKVGGLAFMFEIAGVKGYPFHAFCRTYCLEQYRAWMSEDGVLTDEQGFRVTT